MILVMNQTVRNFEAWKAIFDSGEALRAKHGSTGHTIYRSDDAANDLTIQLRFPSRAAADAFVTDPELAANMKRAGVEGTPDIARLHEAETAEYTRSKAA